MKYSFTRKFLKTPPFFWGLVWCPGRWRSASHEILHMRRRYSALLFFANFVWWSNVFVKWLGSLKRNNLLLLSQQHNILWTSYNVYSNKGCGFTFCIQSVNFPESFTVEVSEESDIQTKAVASRYFLSGSFSSNILGGWPSSWLL